MKNNFKDTIKKLTKKPENKKEQTFQVKVAATIAIILIIAILAGIFIPKLLTFKEGTTGVKDNLALPEAKVEATEPAPKEYTDKYGVQYLETSLPSLGISTFLPKGWNTSSNSTNGIIYINGKIDVDGKQRYLEVALMPTTIDAINTDALTKAFDSILKEQFKYHNGNSVFKVLNYKVNSSSDVYDKNQQVWVDTSEITDYSFYTTQPEDMTLIERQDKYLGVYQNISLNMCGDGTTSSSMSSAKPYGAFYYTYSDNKKALGVSCLGATSYSLQTEEIAKTITYNIRNINSSKKYQMMLLNTPKRIGNLVYYISDDFADSAAGSGKILYRFSDNFNKPEYGIELMVYKTTYNPDTTNYMSLENSDVINSVFNSYHQFKLNIDVTKEENKVIASEISSKTLNIDKQICNQYNYYLDLKYDNKNITRQINTDFPVTNTITFIKDPINSNTLYAVNIRYTDNNKELALKYYDSFISKLSFAS